MIVVGLSWAEFDVAAHVGFRRGLHVIWKGLHDDDGQVRPHFGAHVDGAVAERVVAKALGIYWPATLSLNRSDGDLVTAGGSRLEVRHTRLPNGCLPIHRSDPDAHVAVLVRGTYPTFEVVGAIGVGHAKQEAYWRGDLDRPCYLVPASSLVAIEAIA